MDQKVVEPRFEAHLAARAAATMHKVTFVIAEHGCEPRIVCADKAARLFEVGDPNRRPQILGVGYPPGWRRRPRRNRNGR